MSVPKGAASSPHRLGHGYAAVQVDARCIEGWAWCRPPARELRPLAYHVAPRGPSCSDVPHCPTIPSNLLAVHLDNPTEFVEQQNALHCPRFHGSHRLSANHLVAQGDPG